MSLVLGPHNAMLRGTAEMDRTPPRMSALEGQGYSVFPIDELTIVNANPFARHPDPPLRWLADSGQFDAVLSGADTRRMQAGSATRTAIHHMHCVIVCRASGTDFTILGPRSSAASLHHALAAAAASL